jgi:hypothetical protein
VVSQREREREVPADSAQSGGGGVSRSEGGFALRWPELGAQFTKPEELQLRYAVYLLYWCKSY